MAVSLYLLRQNGDPVCKYGPCRCPDKDEYKHLIEHVCEEIHKVGNCKITLRTTFWATDDEEEHSTIDGELEMFYNGTNDDKKLHDFIERVRDHYWTNLLNIYVDAPDGKRLIDFEFEDIDF